MSTLISVKSILLKNDLLQDSSETKRHAYHEFQAYAYKLAKDLNDLTNLQIYMRLCKTVDRSVMERAFSFVADANTDQKGRLFLWKLKNLRLEIKKQRDLKNFDYDFVMKKIRDLRNKMAQTIIANNDLKYNDSVGIVVENFFKMHEHKSKKALVIGNDSTLLPTIISSFGYKVFGIDVASKLTNILKDNLQNRKLYKFIAKDLLKNSYPNECFDLIVLNKFWQFIPLEKETEILNELKRVLCPNGKIIIGTKTATNEDQSWKELMIEGSEEFSFQKQNTKENLEEKINSLSYDILHCYDLDNRNYYFLSNGH